MSHFTVLVIGEDVEGQLQPFHEFECTGTVDEYVQSVDQLDEAREEYASQKERRFKAPDGTLLSPYDDQFYRDPTPEEWKKIGHVMGSGISSGLVYASRDWGDGLGYRAKVHFTPEGFEEIELGVADTCTFREFVEEYYERPLLAEGESADVEGEHKWGWYRVNADGEVTELTRRTNPNAKWDWWMLGGRWSGLFKLKSGHTGTLGESGLMGSRFAEGDDRCDQARKASIDFESMREAAAGKAGEEWDLARSVAGGESWETWESVRKRIETIESAREFYWNQPAILRLREHDTFKWDVDDSLSLTREEYVNSARNSAGVTFAVLKDGKWYERGRMGWWATVHDPKEIDEWNRQFQALIDSVPDETLLSVVDCHI